MDINNLKKIKAIHQEAGDLVFRMAISHLFDVGVRNLTEESISEAKEEIKETTKSNFLMSANFQCNLLDITFELSTFSIWDILLYIKLYISMDGDKIADKEDAKNAVRMWATEKKEWAEAIKDENIFNDIVDELIDQHVHNNYTREEFKHAFDYVLEQGVNYDMPHLQEAQEWKIPIKLRDLLESFNENPCDVDLYHWDYDEEYATMSDASMKMFTEKGLEHFKTVLDMEVAHIQSLGKNWTSVGLKGAHRSHVESLALSQAGYCPESDYNEWFVKG